MAVPKKRSAKSRASTRYQTYVKKQQKKLLNFVERAKRNERGAAVVASRKEKTAKAHITKIEA